MTSSDGGKPLPGAFDATPANLAEVSPTVYFNVPRRFDMLAAALEREAELRRSFFRDLDLVLYAGAALPQSLWQRPVAASRAERGEPVPLVSAWGSTETSPLATQVHFPTETASVIGLPAPGVAVKLAPAGAEDALDQESVSWTTAQANSGARASVSSS